MIKAYWLRILIFAVCGALLAFAGSKLVKPKYEAQVQIMVDQTMPGVAPDASPETMSTVDKLMFGRPRNIITQVDQLQSLGVVTEAARKIAESRGLTAEFNDPNGELNPVNVKNNIYVSADPNSDIIDFRLRMTDDQLVKDLADEIYLAFDNQNEQESKQLADRAITSLKTEASNIDQQLKDIDAKSAELRAKTGFPDVANQIQAEVNSLAQLRQARDQAAMDSAGAHQTVSVLQGELARTPPTMPQSATEATNPVWEHLAANLVDAQAKLDEELAHYYPDSDIVKETKAEISGIQGQMDKLKQNIPAQSSSGPNSNYLALQQQIATARAAADSADQKLKVADSVVAEREKYLQSLPPIQTELASLARQQMSLEKIYLSYQDELKALEASKEGRTSPTQEITRATVFPDPVSPKPSVNAFFGAVVGILLGVFTMLYTEGKRQPIRSLAQLNGLAYQPVYRLIPELREPYQGLQKAPPEQFESLLANYLRTDARPYRIAVVGVTKDAGASTTALNLAIAGARHGAGVLLVQSSAKGALSKAGVKESAGGGTVNVMHSLNGLCTDTVLTAGDHDFGIATQVAASEVELTIIDLEPASRAAEYAFVAPYVDEVILLVRAGVTRTVEFMHVQQALRDAGCKRMTTVFTRASDFSVVVDVAEEEAPVALAPARVVEAPLPKVAGAAPETKSTPASVLEAPSGTLTETPSAPTAPGAEPAPMPEAAEVETPARRARSTPNVTIEDFGGIARAKQPEQAPEPDPKGKGREQKPGERRARIDTSEIDS